MTLRRTPWCGPRTELPRRAPSTPAIAMRHYVARDTCRRHGVARRCYPAAINSRATCHDVARHFRRRHGMAGRCYPAAIKSRAQPRRTLCLPAGGVSNGRRALQPRRLEPALTAARARLLPLLGRPFVGPPACRQASLPRQVGRFRALQLGPRPVISGSREAQTECNLIAFARLDLVGAGPRWPNWLRLASRACSPRLLAGPDLHVTGGQPRGRVTGDPRHQPGLVTCEACLRV